MEDRNAFRSAQGRSSRARPLRLKNSKTGCEFSIASRVRISSRSAGAPLGVEAARSLPALSPTPPCASRRRSRARRPLHTTIAPRTTIVNRHGGRGSAWPIPRTKSARVGHRALGIVPARFPLRTQKPTPPHLPACYHRRVPPPRCCHPSLPTHSHTLSLSPPLLSC